MAKVKKHGAGGRKQFVRTRIPPAEKIVSGVILLMIGVIGLAVYFQGKHYNPDRYLVSAASLKSTEAAVKGKSDTIVSSSSSTLAQENSSTQAKSSSATAGPAGNNSQSKAAGKPLMIKLPGIKPMSATEFYNANTLYEKIDGRSPAYQKFNVQELRCRTFTVNAAPGSYVDVYEYRFDSPVDAFGMYSLERDPHGQPIDFAPDGYFGGMGYFFRQGSFYVQVMGSDQKSATLAAAKAIALNCASELPVDNHGLAGRRKLPVTGLVPHSVSFVPANAQGQSTFTNVYQATYQYKGTTLPFFIMVAPPAQSANAWQSFQKFCARFGKVTSLPDVNGAKLFRAQVFGKWKIVYLRQNELGGVYDAKDKARALEFVEKFLRGDIK